MDNVRKRRLDRMRKAWQTVDKAKAKERVKITAKTFQITVYTVTLIGFSYQAFLVCEEFFKYKTITTVTVEGALPQTNYPQIAFCAEWQIGGYKDAVEIFHRHQNPPNGSYPWGDVHFAWVNINRNARSTRKSKDPLFYSPAEEMMVISKFLQRRSSCFSLKTKHPLNMSPTELFRNPVTRTIDLMLYKNIPYTGFEDYWNSNATATDITYHIYMTSYNSDFDAPSLVPLTQKAKKLKGNMFIYISYSQKVTRLYPPPYDTNCHDYRKAGLSSQHTCVRTCVNDWTVKLHGLIFEDHVVDYDKYFSPNSTSRHRRPLSPIWFALKDSDMTADYLFNISNKNYKLAEQLKGNESLADQAASAKLMGDDMKKLGEIFPDLRDKMKLCDKECQQPNCETEYVVPHEIGYENYGNSMDKKSKKRIKYGVKLGIHPPKEPVVVVTSKEKLILLDFVVYVLSCLSFWFGFCPLAAADQHKFLFRRLYQRGKQAMKGKTSKSRGHRAVGGGAENHVMNAWVAGGPFKTDFKTDYRQHF